MIYDLTLKFTYEYRSAVKDARHVLRIRPRSHGGQDVIAQSVRIAPEPDEAMSDRDFFGNVIDHVRLRHAHERLDIEMRARVRAAEAVPDLGATPSLDALRRAAGTSRDSGPRSPVHFLGLSRLVEPSADVGAYVRKALGEIDAAAMPAGPALLRLAARIREDFAYVPGSTRIDTTVDEVLRTRRGVCQDFSHLMIAGLRGVGIAAGYVSGFLRTDPPPGRSRLQGADAMHAWVMVWLGADHGWAGFDPTNGSLAGDDHVEVAVGRDYADVAPVGGVVITSGPQRSRHSVDMIPLAEGTA